MSISALLAGPSGTAELRSCGTTWADHARALEAAIWAASYLYLGQLAPLGRSIRTL